MAIEGVNDQNGHELQGVPLDGVPHIQELTDEEKFREEHRKLHKLHEGHEEMHAAMIIIFFVILVVSQIALVQWKQRHFHSYQMATLAAMWIIPVVISLRSGYWRFIGFWVLFSVITGLVAKKVTQSPIERTTPRLVYKWFYFLYKLSLFLGIVGYIIIVLTLLGVNFIFGSMPQVWMDCGGLIMFYGLYYGVLGQDLAEICSNKMALHIGYYTPDGMPTRHLEDNTCAVCGDLLFVRPDQPGVIENTYKLSCNHEFHEFCIRGWCIVGKKQICPYCKEKVDLKLMFVNLWEKPHVFYGQLLDWLRWLVAWQPVILALIQGVNYMLDLK
ncbi:hypothetical protein M8J76_007385 [Diaphorina citri]|nr:hypothetical protein M8J75_016337 [Diaphorina citri]KAI5733075.1 hypothetical protein M8J76_007385 [Diaphorina citri]